jgi:hypothetical protein
MKQPGRTATFNSGFQDCRTDANIDNTGACESVVKIGTSGGTLRTVMKLWFHKRLGNSSPSKRLLASQEELSYMELISTVVGKTQMKKPFERTRNG